MRDLDQRLLTDSLGTCDSLVRRINVEAGSRSPRSTLMRLPSPIKSDLYLPQPIGTDDIPTPDSTIPGLPEFNEPEVTRFRPIVRDGYTIYLSRSLPGTKNSGRFPGNGTFDLEVGIDDRLDLVRVGGVFNSVVDRIVDGFFVFLGWEGSSGLAGLGTFGLDGGRKFDSVDGWELGGRRGLR